MWPNPQGTSDQVTFTEETFNGKLHFLCSGLFYFRFHSFQIVSVIYNIDEDLLRNFTISTFLWVFYINSRAGKIIDKLSQKNVYKVGNLK